MPILYSAIASEKIIISNFASCDGNFREITSEIISKIPDSDDRMTYYHGPYLIHYKVEDCELYLCITDKFCQRSRAFLFLNEIQRNYQAKSCENLTELLANEMYRYSEDYNNIVIRQGELDELNEIGVESSETILGEKLLLVNNPEQISYGTVTYVGKTPERISMEFITDDTSDKSIGHINNNDVGSDVKTNSIKKLNKKKDSKEKSESNKNKYSKENNGETNETKSNNTPKTSQNADKNCVIHQEVPNIQSDNNWDTDVKKEITPKVNTNAKSNHQKITEQQTNVKPKAPEIKHTSGEKSIESNKTEVRKDVKPKQLTIKEKVTEPTKFDVSKNIVKPKQLIIKPSELTQKEEDNKLNIPSEEKTTELNDLKSPLQNGVSKLNPESLYATPNKVSKKSVKEANETMPSTIAKGTDEKGIVSSITEEAKVNDKKLLRIPQQEKDTEESKIETVLEHKVSNELTNVPKESDTQLSEVVSPPPRKHKKERLISKSEETDIKLQEKSTDTNVLKVTEKSRETDSKLLESMSPPPRKQKKDVLYAVNKCSDDSKLNTKITDDAVLEHNVPHGTKIPKVTTKPTESDKVSEIVSPPPRKRKESLKSTSENPIGTVLANNINQTNALKTKEISKPDSITDEQWKQYINSLEIEPIAKVDSNLPVGDNDSNANDISNNSTDNQALENVPSENIFMQNEETPTTSNKLETKIELTEEELRIQRMGIFVGVFLLIMTALHIFGPVSCVLALGASSVYYEKNIKNGAYKTT